jgi:hypothetical protein
LAHAQLVSPLSLSKPGNSLCAAVSTSVAVFALLRACRQNDKVGDRLSLVLGVEPTSPWDPKKTMGCSRIVFQEAWIRPAYSAFGSFTLGMVTTTHKHLL